MMTAEQFWDIRQKLNLSQKALGIHLRCSAELIKKIEAGKARITPKKEQDLLWLEKNPPIPPSSNSPGHTKRRGRPSGTANRPRDWQEDKAEISWGMILGGTVAMVLLILAMVFFSPAGPLPNQA
jgi:hypothetical protein